MSRIVLFIALFLIIPFCYSQDKDERKQTNRSNSTKESTTQLYTTKLVTIEVKRRNVIETRKVYKRVPVGTKGIRLKGPAAKNRRFAH